MNRGLLAASIILVLLGAFSGFYFLAGVGVLLFFPALLSSPPRPAQKAPSTTTKTPPRRITPPSPPAPMGLETRGETKLPETYMTPSSQPSQASYSSALFPTPMFPSLSRYGMTSGTDQPLPSKEPQKREAETNDLLEVGVLLAILKLASG